MSVLFNRGEKLEQNHYTILKELGVGGMGVVYHCRDEQLMRDVAIKMLLPELMADKSSVEIFQQEARLAAQLEHPHVVRVYDIGVEERQKKQHHYVCMEYLPGGNLAHSLSSPAGRSVESCLNWMKQLASGLAFAHKRGVIHQDIKADNIFLTNEGDLKIGDFGLARLLVGRMQTDSTIRGMGTPAYMSPELCRGEQQDHRSDIYSLGVLFFEMATGQLPYRARGMIEMATKHSSAPIPSVRRINPAIPEVLEKMIRRMMGKVPEERYASMSEVLNLLDDLIFELRVARIGLTTHRPTMRSGPIITERAGSEIESPKEEVAAQVVLPVKSDAEREAELHQLGERVQQKQTAASQSKAAPVEQSNAASAKLISELDVSAKGAGTGIAAASSAAGVKSSDPFTDAFVSHAGLSGAHMDAVSTTTQHGGGSPGGGMPAPGLTYPKRPFADAKPQSGLDARTGGPAQINTDQKAVDSKALPKSPTPPVQKSSPAAPAAAGSARREEASKGTSARGSVARSDPGAAKIEGLWKPSLRQIWAVKTQGPIGFSSYPVVDREERNVLVASTDGALYSIDLKSGEINWQFASREPFFSAPRLLGETIFVADSSGTVFSLNRKNGALQWKSKLSSSVVGSPAAGNDLLCVATTGGELVAMDVFSGSSKWRYRADGPIVCSPFKHGNVLFFGTKTGSLQAIAERDGRLLWSCAAGAPVIASPSASVDSVYFATMEGMLYALSAENGGLVWAYQTDSAIASKAVVSFTYVIFCSHDRWLYACEKYDGSLKWKAAVRGKVFADLVVHRDEVIVASQEGWLQGFHSRTGALVWQKHLGCELESPPVISGDLLLQATISGDILALSTEALTASGKTA
jgi:serine/threonine protein kinase/outer membrane protein assembly factor BamB